jgi:hypothetical protein
MLAEAAELHAKISDLVFGHNLLAALTALMQVFESGMDDLAKKHPEEARKFRARIVARFSQN